MRKGDGKPKQFLVIYEQYNNSRFHCQAIKYKLNANHSKQEAQNRGNGRSKKRYK